MKEKPTILYEVIEDGEVVYVGVSVAPKSRLRAHIKDGRVSTRATLRLVQRFKKRRRAEMAEQVRIRKLSPKANTRHHPENCLFIRRFTHPEEFVQKPRTVTQPERT